MGKGTHGSITKAGKVRSQTPKIEPMSNRKSKSPKLANRNKYKKRVLLKRKIGQTSMYNRRR